MTPEAKARFDKASKKQYYNATPLWAAVEAGNTYMVQTLLSLGADPLTVIINYVDKSSLTAKTPRYISETVLDTVVDRFAKSSVSSASGLFVTQTKLDPDLFACGNLVWQAVLKLPAKKQPKFAKDQVSNVFAYFAPERQQIDQEELLKTGTNTIDLIPYAVLTRNWDIVDLIYKYNGLQIDQPAVISDNGTETKETAIQWAVSNDYVDAVRFLKDNGAALPELVSFRNTQGQSDSLPLWPMLLLETEPNLSTT